MATKKYQKLRFDMPSPLQGGVPWLVYPCQGSRYRKQKFYSIVDGRVEERCNKLLQASRCRASAYGWMLIQNFGTPLVFLFNPFSSQQCYLPKLVNEKPNKILIVSDPGQADCFIVGMYTKEHPYFLYTSPRGKSWSKFMLDVWDDIDSFTIAVVSCNGKLFLLISDFTLVVIQFTPLPMVKKFTTKIRDRCFLSIIFASSFNLVESLGELFLVETILYTKPNSSPPRTLMVFKLDFSTMTWDPANTLNESIFVLSDYNSYSFMSPNTNLKGDRIYIVDENVLYCFDMEYQSLTLSYPLSDSAYNECLHFWLVVPDDTQMNYTRKEASNFAYSYEKFHFDHPRLLSLPGPSTCLIIQPSKFSPRWHPRTPWLMFVHKDNGVYKVLDPSTKSAYEVLVPGLSGSVILASVDGWLFAQVSSLNFCFVNPFSKEKVILPRSPLNPFCIAFSAPPTSSDCKIFFILHLSYMKPKIQISIHQIGDKKWTTRDFDVSPTFQLAHNYGVYLDGRIYCLGMNGHLGVYDSTTNSWVVHYLSVNIKVEAHSCALVESRSKLLSVFIDFFQRPIGMFEFDMDLCRWRRVVSIGDRTFFFGQGASYCVTSYNESMENMIYFPSFKKECSLDLVTYPLSSVGSVSNTLINPKIEYLHVWIEPKAGVLCGLRGTNK